MSKVSQEKLKELLPDEEGMKKFMLLFNTSRTMIVIRRNHLMR